MTPRSQPLMTVAVRDELSAMGGRYGLSTVPDCLFGGRVDATGIPSDAPSGERAGARGSWVDSNYELSLVWNRHRIRGCRSRRSVELCRPGCGDRRVGAVVGGFGRLYDGPHARVSAPHSR